MPRSLIVLILAAAPSLTAGTLYQGTFSTDDQIQLFTITANSFETVTIQTYSYAGGTFDSTAIAGGGFTPSAFLFDGLGDVAQLNPGTCGQVATDPSTQECNDLYYQNLLGPGTYTLALAVYSNTPNDGFVGDGFAEDGNPGFTCGGSPNFCDLTTAFPTDNVRDGDFAISISGADSVSEAGGSGAPEPGSALLLLAGAVTWSKLRRRVIR